jgi:hypothetical protein
VYDGLDQTGSELPIRNSEDDMISFMDDSQSSETVLLSPDSHNCAESGLLVNTDL